MCGFEKSRISIVIVRSTGLIFCGSWDKGARIWGVDGTDCALAGLNQGETSRDDGKGGGKRVGHGDGQRSDYSKGDIKLGIHLR